MKRVNLILTNEQYLILQKKSQQYGIPKAHYLRNLIEQKINEQIGISLKVNLKKWKLFGGVTFNLRVITPIYDWLEKTSFLANCSKSDLIRHIIDLDSEVVQKKFLYYSTKKQIENIVQNNITSLISTKQYSGLNKYIST